MKFFLLLNFFTLPYLLNISLQGITNNNLDSSYERINKISKTKPIEIIHCTGRLRRPKELVCDGYSDQCHCGLGVCNFHCTVLGLEVFRATKGLPIDEEQIDKDQVVTIKSTDGKYLLYKFIHFVGRDREENKEQFIIDNEIIYECMAETRVSPQTPKTFYKADFEEGVRYFETVSNGDDLYFGISKEELHLENAICWSIVQL